jgi:hypothetical protein
MITQLPKIQVGLADFADPTLLLLGDAAAFRWLANEVRARREVKLGAEQSGDKRATLQVVPAETAGEFSRNGNRFSWRISSSEAETVARQLSALADSQVPAHAYIDPALDSTGVQLMASVGEYDASRVF